ncbi:ComF family protein [Streptomyces cinnabarinus]|uniref:ComF family protein n=1 Tax=Streptomyces cinnabarinus TaxID=67287 RepID=A0ABY7KEN4_9ACTN|nr:ComF family protein [Streptomyces cinnabarinus]WAZ22135.1 ComF family protein [Streptomyces cinnabarinus]
MRGWWRDLTDLVLPAECGGCGQPRTVLCPQCRTALSGVAPCRVRPDPEPPGLPVVHAAARYADEVRAVLLAHKERGALALAAPLGVALAGAVREGLRAEHGPRGGAVLLVPVPSARGAVRARGHDPARRIALAAAAELRRAGTPARVLAVLRQRRAVADQSGLNSRQRLDNLAGALEVAPGGGRLLGGGPGGGSVVLVDDLMTTGASLAEAARAVREGAAGGAGGDGRERTGRTVRLIGGDAGVTAVCTAVGREDRQHRGERSAEVKAEAVVRRHGVPGMARGIPAGDGLCAAVVAASPDAFEINRN